MKIRSDYVSNSSSSSFIVVLPKDYEMDKFITDVVHACSDEDDYTYSTDEEKAVWKKRVDAFNRRNLDYCMNTYKLLYLGSLIVGETEGVVEGKRECEEFRKCTKDMPPEELKIVSESKDRIVYSEPNVYCGVTVTNRVMEYSIRMPAWDERDDEEKSRKSRVKSILECVNDSRNHSFFFHGDSSAIYEITLDTINNTEDLIAEGHEVVLDDWCKDLPALKKRIENGDRIFGIEMCQGGDGMNSTSIYALNGWDSDFNKYSDVEVLYSEVG